MKNTKRNLIGLLIILVVSMFWWINKIDSPSQRIVGILMISTISYLVGRLHKGYLNRIGAVGMDHHGPPL